MTQGATPYSRAIARFSLIVTCMAAFVVWPRAYAPMLPWITRHILEMAGPENVHWVLVLWQIGLFGALWMGFYALLGLILSSLGLVIALILFRVKGGR